MAWAHTHPQVTDDQQIIHHIKAHPVAAEPAQAIQLD